MAQSLKMFSIYDKKAMVYGNPFCCRHKAEAIRSLDELTNDASTRINKYPNDFSIWEIAEFDDQTGIITAKNLPLFLEEAATTLKQGAKNGN